MGGKNGSCESDKNGLTQSRPSTSSGQAEVAGKDIILLRLNPDLVRFSLRSLRL